MNEMTPDINDDTCQLNFGKDSPIVYGCSSDFSFFSKPEIFMPTLEVVKTILCALVNCQLHFVVTSNIQSGIFGFLMEKLIDQAKNKAFHQLARIITER